MEDIPNILVIGIGNEFRGDDILGFLVVRRLKKLLQNSQDKVKCCEHIGDGTSLISLWQPNQIVFLVDAIYSKGKESGVIYRLNLRKESLPLEWFYSTHSFNLAEAIELARILDQLPFKIILYGISGKNFEIGQQISFNLCKALEDATNKILKEIESFL
jgi:hydrogenase maturation protease